MSRSPASAATPLVLLGGSSLCGEALLALLPQHQHVLHLCRSRPATTEPQDWSHCDLAEISPAALDRIGAALPAGPQVWLCFAHLWLLAPWLAALARHRPEQAGRIEALVACSSSSVITKRFATNRFDRGLVERLAGCQGLLEQVCAQHRIPLRILAPTLIYGRTAHHTDRNVETLRRLLRRLPLIPLPAHTGLRQPIAAADLAAVALLQVRELAAGQAEGPALLPLGGDEALSYRQLLERIQSVDPHAARCRLLPLPTRLFQFLAAPLLLVSPKAFEAVLRLGADLAGFPTVASLLQRRPGRFEPRP